LLLLLYHHHQQQQQQAVASSKHCCCGRDLASYQDQLLQQQHLQASAPWPCQLYRLLLLLVFVAASECLQQLL
jgi:hypothetical protein